MEELIKNEEFMKKLESAESPEEAVALFKDNGVEVTVEELERIAKMGSGELDEEMLDDVPVAIAAAVAVAAAIGKIFAKNKGTVNIKNVRRFLDVTRSLRVSWWKIMYAKYSYEFKAVIERLFFYSSSCNRK